MHAQASSVARPLRVLVDAVSARVGGGATYAIAQLAAVDQIADLHLTIHAHGYAAGELMKACPNSRVCEEPARSLPYRLAWEQTVLAARARDHDVVYALGNFALLRCPRPQVVLLQNASYFTGAIRAFPRRHLPAGRRSRLALESAFARASIRCADRIVAVSQSLADAIEEDLGPLPHLSVVPTPPPLLPPPADMRGRDLPRAYVVAVSNDAPHKGWDQLVTTWTSTSDLPPLVVVGVASPARLAALRARLAAGNAGGRVVFLGALANRAEVAGLYAGATCCLAHSHREALGLTPVEALSLGVPVAASDIPAHREACGDAPRYYPVSDGAALAAAVRGACGQPRRVPAGEGLFGMTWGEHAATLAEILRAAALAPPADGERPRDEHDARQG